VKEVRTNDYFNCFDKNIKHRIKIENKRKEIGKDIRHFVEDLKTSNALKGSNANLKRGADANLRTIKLRKVAVKQNREFVPANRNEIF